MKAISLWQPHATLFAIGARHIETRGEWALRIKYRGPLLIHASKKWNADMAWNYVDAGVTLKMNGFDVDMSPSQKKIYGTAGKDLLGRILAIGELYDVKPIPDVPTEGLDRFFGSFGPGRVGLFIRNVRAIVPTIPFKGAQGLFDVPDHVVKEYL